MIDIKKGIIISALVLVILGAAVAGKNQAFAQSANSGPISTLVQMIADKFNLNKNDVQAVFDQYKTDRKTTMQTKFDQMLTQAVQDGKITEAQKQLILTKRQELRDNRKANFDNFKNMTSDQRKTAMQSQKQELEAWAKQNGIDLKYLIGRFGMGGHGHFK